VATTLAGTKHKPSSRSSIALRCTTKKAEPVQVSIKLDVPTFTHDDLNDETVSRRV
tara:strand:- start:694 stop:861 length:168 start_codon:yes stop_codon:yes gene_type:complete